MSLPVILIIVHKEKINEFEKISLRQCYKILGEFPIRIICPKGMSVSSYRAVNRYAEFDFINYRWLKDYWAFAHFKMHPFIYSRYKKHGNMLFYELDSFVFKNELINWCNSGYDYMGAPWFEGHSKPISERMIGVGNGGFSLRNAESCIRALHSFSIIYRTNELPKLSISGAPGDIIRLVNLFFSVTGFRNNSYYLLGSPEKREDIFWGKYIKRNFNWFRVPEPQIAMKFSFEVNPRILYEWNSRSLPFGCHAWYKYDFAFWKPFIEKEGYDLSGSLNSFNGGHVG